MKPSRHLSSTLWLSAFFILHSSLALGVHAQRADNRRLVWTGSAGMDWSSSSSSSSSASPSSWTTSGSYLAYVQPNSTNATWLPSDPLDPAPFPTPFLTGDTVIFDSTSDIDPTSNPTSNPAATRTINIAPDGVTASELILSGAGSYTFTGGAITTDAGSIAPGSMKLTGTGSGVSAANVSPAGRLVKLNTGDLTLSSTAPNTFTGGIHLAAGRLVVTNTHALGSNNICLLPASTASGSNTQLPATVTNAAGFLLRAGGSLLSPVTLHIPASAAGIDITGDIFLGSQMLTLDIQGETLLSGRIYGDSNNYGASGGTLVKTGPGTLTITGTHNAFYAAGNNTTTANTSRIDEGRLVITSPYAIGSGAWIIAAGSGTLEFRGVKGAMKQTFFGGGDIEITQGSDLTLNWKSGTLIDYDSLPASVGQPADNALGRITVSGASRFSAIASGTSSSVLGGAGAQVFIREGSTLVLGREGISSRVTGVTKLPVTYPIHAMRVSLAGASTLVLNPNAFLDVGAFDLSADSTITFGASGVSQLRYLSGPDPDTLTSRYVLPDGMKLVAVNPLATASGYHHEFVVVNQGANPLKDIAMTLNALDAVHDTLSTRLAVDFLDPVAPRLPARGRKWTNSAWARYIVSQVDYDSISIDTPGVTGRISGAILGADGILPGEFLVGLHAGATENNLATTNNTTLSSKQKFLGLHATQRFGKFHVAATAATGRARTDTLRHEPASLVRGKWDTSYYTATIETGLTLSPLEKTTIKPHASLRYTKIKITNYYERGPSPLLVDNFNDTGVQASAGLSAGRKFTLLKRDLALDLTLARKHTVTAPRATLQTAYYDSPSTPVTLDRGDYYTNITAAGISLRLAMSRNTFAALSYDHETSPTHTRFAITALVGCSW